MEYTVTSGYDRTKHPASIRVRDITKAETLALTGHAKMIANDGKLRDIKINGKVRTWKTNPSRIEVPCKYGMYECATFHWTDGIGDIPSGLVTDVARIVVVLDETETEPR